MNRTSISDLKAKAKDQLLGNYGIATGSFALLFVLIYAITMVIASATTMGYVREGYAGPLKSGLWGSIISQAMSIVIGTLTMIFSVGFIRIMLKISNNERALLSDLFFAFRNHPDKVIIVSLILTGVQFVLLLPATIVSGRAVANGESVMVDGKMFLLWVVLYIAGIAISYVIDLMFSMSFLIYLEEPETNVSQIISGSISMMKGNKFRYFYMTLSFIGYWFLAIVSLGIAFLWVVPYQTMTMVEFYKDLRGDI